VVTLCVLTIGCASTENSEVACNFVSGADSNQYDENDSFNDSLSEDIVTGLLNILLQGAHRAISPQNYSPCVAPEPAICIEPNAELTNACTVNN